MVLHKEELESSAKELIEQFRNLWPVFNKIWLKYGDHKKTQHMQFVDHVLSQYTVTHSHLCDLEYFLARSYSKPAKPCFKDRNWLSFFIS